MALIEPRRDQRLGTYLALGLGGLGAALATGRPEVREALASLLGVFERHILVTPEHLGLYFDRDWSSTNKKEEAYKNNKSIWQETGVFGPSYQLSLTYKM